MRAAIGVVVVTGFLMLNAGAVGAEDPKAKPAMTPEQQAAMEKMQKLGSPSEGHKALEPFAGNWTYTLKWWMQPDAPAESMSGNTKNSLVLGGRFLKQEISGEASEAHPAFEGLGYTGYDNLRKEYQTVWLDNMNTSMMRGAGQYDAATKTLTQQGDFSCPMTGETHRQFRDAWTIVDANHATYESYSKTPDGREFKSMEIQYTRQ